MARTTGISGFPEWLPGERLVEQHVLDVARDVFELHGFSSIDTRAVEPLDQLLRKGETDKEIYLLRRLQAEDEGSDSGLGLHFDLTVPFARYVLENAGHLDFPFRRYQIQKAWRGERPQEGRYREFVQADIDVVDRDTLPFHYEVELPLVMAEVLRRLPIPPVRMRVNNRRILDGFCQGLGIADRDGVLRSLDRLDKVGPAPVQQMLVDVAGCTPEQADACLSLATITSVTPSFADRVREFGVKDDLLEQGLDELVQVIDAGAQAAPGLLVADLSIARGLDYYTSTVYETVLVGHEKLGSICSGGRYDSLASDGSTTYPGVGLSLGVTRLLARLIGQDLVTATRSVPTCVLVALPDDSARRDCETTAASLRRRGIPCHVAPTASKYGKQIRFAERRGIPYVWFPQDDGSHEVRDIRTGLQTAADPETWAPPSADLRPSVTSKISPDSAGATQ